ncbi:MAG: hypothetical protein ABIF01_05240 [Candidatus Micrarchaeota archaeon]
MEELEKSFRSLTKVLLGKELVGLHSYAGWLQENVRMSTEQKSIVSGKPIYLPYFSFFQATKNRLMNLDEVKEFAHKHLDEKDVEELTLSNSQKFLKPISAYCPVVGHGQTMNVEKTSLYGESSFCYLADGAVKSKYCAYCLWPRESECIFGCDFIFSSKFCLKCYKSENLVRCLEVSHSNNCSDCYFCHNCDNLQECMFCSNVKSMRYAIGNVEVGKEAYAKVKKLVLGEMANRLDGEKRLSHNVFNLGCVRRTGSE